MANREAIQQWADALRYGSYQKGEGELREKRGDGYGLCGLGVACQRFSDLRGLDVGEVVQWPKVHPMLSYLPAAVSDWLGIDKDTEERIVRMNDDTDLTLPEIGDWVADNLLKEE